MAWHCASYWGEGELAPDHEDLGPRAREVVMSAALAFTGRVCSFLTKDRR